MKAAVIGLGLGKTHAEVYDRRREVTAIALCDADLDAARAFASQLHKPVTCYDSVETLFEREAVDIASIVTPDNWHRQHATAALEAGAEVLLTKPIATTLEDAQAIVDCARAQGRKLMVAHERRFRPSYVRAHELIASGKLGELIYLRLEMFQYAQGKFTRAPWYASKEAGRTAITGSGIHQVDLVRWLSGREVVSVRALGNRIGDINFHHNKTVIALFELEGGVIGEVAFTYEATPPLGGEKVTAIGSRGMIDDGRFRSRDGSEQGLRSASGDGGENETEFTGSARAVEAFVDAIASGAAMPVTGEEAVLSLAAALAIDRACESGQSESPAPLTVWLTAHAAGQSEADIQVPQAKAPTTRSVAMCHDGSRYTGV
jgi:UDP-N-acetylglucosamine 3-dehydrogenase